MRIGVLIFLFLSVQIVKGQTNLDSLLTLVKKSKEDTSAVNLIGLVVSEMRRVNADSAICWSTRGLELSKKIKWEKGIATHTYLMGWSYSRKGNYDSALDYYLKALELFKLVAPPDGGSKYALVLSSIGQVYNSRGDFKKAEECYEASSKSATKYKNLELIGNNYANLGGVYQTQGNYPKSLELFLKALKISEGFISSPNPSLSKLGKHNSAVYYNRIGNSHLFQSEFDKAKTWYLKALKMSEELKEKPGIADNYTSLAIIYSEMKQAPLAVEYFLKALKMQEELGDRKGASMALGNLGGLYLNEGARAAEGSLTHDSLLNIAAGYIERCLKIKRELKTKSPIAIHAGNLGAVYTHLKRYDEAEKYINESLELSEKNNMLSEKSVALKNACVLYDKKGDYKKALEYFKSYVTLRDTLVNEEKNKELTKQLMNYDFEKKEALAKAAQEKKEIAYQAEIKQKQTVFEFEQKQLLLKTETEKKDISMRAEIKQKQADEDFKRKEAVAKVNQEKEREVASINAKRKNVIIWSVIAGLIMLFLFSLLIFNRLRITNRQKKIIEIQKQEVEKQKHIVENHQKEIIDSITYAKRLQRAILPSDATIKQYLPNSFILYQPKDIVAGDFYWMEHIGNTTFIAAADSTGHGVPGAMVSIVCSNALDKAVKEFGLTDPGKILDKTRELVLATFAKSGEEIKDGMDISLLTIDRKTKQIFWSGANNPLLFIENDELKEIKPDKQSIGKTDHPKPFMSHPINYNVDTMFYLLTDGFADQFGGDNGKKFKIKQLKETLVSIAGSSFDLQKDTLDNKLKAWKGNLEQVDDVTIIGVQV